MTMVILVTVALSILAGVVATLVALTPMRDQWDAMRRALYDIAGEQKIYKSHGDYDIIPACTAKDAQMRAQHVIVHRKIEPPPRDVGEW